MIDINELRGAVEAAFPAIFGEEATVVICEDFPNGFHSGHRDHWQYSKKVVEVRGYPFLLRPLMRPQLTLKTAGLPTAFKKKLEQFPGAFLEEVVMAETGEEDGPEPENQHVLDILPNPARTDLVIRCAIAKLFAAIAEEKTHRSLVAEPDIGPVPF